MLCGDETAEQSPVKFAGPMMRQLLWQEGVRLDHLQETNTNEVITWWC